MYSIIIRLLRETLAHGKQVSTSKIYLVCLKWAMILKGIIKAYMMLLNDWNHWTYTHLIYLFFILFGYCTYFEHRYLFKTFNRYVLIIYYSISAPDSFVSFANYYNCAPKHLYLTLIPHKSLIKMRRNTHQTLMFTSRKGLFMQVVLIWWSVVFSHVLPLIKIGR